MLTIVIITDDVILTVEHEDRVLPILVKAQDKYYYIGKGIGVSDEDRKVIEDRHLPDKVRCLDEILKRRIRQGRLTCSMLCQSLRGVLVGRDDVAQEIEDLKLTQSPKIYMEVQRSVQLILNCASYSISQLQNTGNSPPT